MAIQKSHTTLAAVAAIAVSAAAPAHAEGLELGGYITVSTDYSTDGFFGSNGANIDFDLAIGYRAGPWYFGISQLVEGDFDNPDLFSDPDQPIFMVGYGDILVSYGEFEGAGNLFPDDYFGITDTSDVENNTVRVDYAPGGDSWGIEHVAISYDMGEDDLHDALELGLRLAISGTIIGIGYEGDENELGVIVARDFGDTRVHGIAHFDPDSDDTDIGLSAFQMFGDVELGAHVEFEPTDNDGNLLEAIGLAGYYETGLGTLSGQVRHEFDSFTDGETIVEFGLVIPFGDSAPYAAQRMDTSENMRRFGF